MVEANEDALAVTMKIRRETRIAKERAAAEGAAGEVSLPPPVPAAAPHPASLEATVSVLPSIPTTPPPDAEAAFRRARLGVVAAIVLALLLVWIAQRRANLPRRSPRLV